MCQEVSLKQIFTFGRGQKNKGRYVVIEAKTKECCRNKMIDRFGMEWAYRYEIERIEAIKKSGLIELK